MPRHPARRFGEPAVDSRIRRKLEDPRRMQFRRAIEDRAEQRLLQREPDAYPELIALNGLSGSRDDRRSAPPAH